MHVHLIVFLIFFIHLSDQLCKFSCDINSDNNCVNKTKTQVNSTVLDATNGIVDFQFKFLCNIEKYDIRVKYNNYSKNECYLKTFKELTHHSSYSFEQKYSSKLQKCAEMGHVLLQNIQTGCYRITILDKRGFYLYRDFSYWHTSYIKQEVNTSRTIIKYNTRYNATELKFHIDNPILSSHPNLSLKLACKNCENFTTQEYVLIQDYSDKTKLILDPNKINTESNVSCTLTRKENGNVVANCNIFPVSAGSYDIKVTFSGDPYKCPYYTTGDNVQDIEGINITPPEIAPATQLLNDLNWEITIGSTFGVLFFFISLLIVILIIKLSKRKINDDIPNTNERIASYGASCSNLLLLYARNSEAIMTTLASLRKFFIYQKIQVYDIYDPARLKEINENHTKWILNLINRDDMKILIFLTPNGQDITLPTMQDSTDYYYTFAINQLFCKITRDSDFSRKICVAHFSNDSNKYSNYDLFSPHKRFRMPDHLKMLLEHILNSEGGIEESNNEYNKFLENYEKLKRLQEEI